MGHAETLKSTLAELAQHENKLNFISTGRVQGRKKPNAVWDLAILYVFIEQYLHPSSVTLTFSGNHFKLGLKWTYSAYDFVLLFEGDLGEIGSITLTYPVSDAPPIFQWTMGDLKLGALFNFFSWALTCSVHAIKDIYANLIVSQKLTNTIETKFVTLLGDSLVHALPLAFYMAPASACAKECFIGGLLRKSVSSSLTLYTQVVKHSTTLMEHYTHCPQMSSITRYTFLGAEDLPPHAPRVYPLLAFCLGMVHQANIINNFRVSHSAILRLDPIIYKAQVIQGDSLRTLLWLHLKDLVEREEDAESLLLLYHFFKQVTLDAGDADPFSILWDYSSKWDQFVEVSSATKSTWAITEG